MQRSLFMTDNLSQTPNLPHRKRGSKFFLALWYTVATVIIVMAVLVSIARLFTPTVARYKDDILKQASNQVGYPIQIQSLDASWLGLRPVLKLSGVDVFNSSTDKSVLHINHIYLAIDLSELIFAQKIATAQLVLTGSRASVWHDNQNQYWLGGPSGILLNPEKQPAGFNPLEFLFAQPQVSIKDIDIQFQSAQSPKKAIYLKELGLVNHQNHHRILTKLRLNEHHNSELNVLVKLVGKITSPQQWRAQMFVHGHQINFGDWHAILDFFPQYQLSGNADFSLWLDWKNFLRKFQINIDWNHPVLQSTQPEYTTLRNLKNINNISGQFTWINDQKKGWLFSGNKVHLSIAKKEFINSDFFIQKKVKNVLLTQNNVTPPTTSDWDIYFGHLDLDLVTTLNQLKLSLPMLSQENVLQTETVKPKESLSHLLDALNPKGKIEHFQLHFSYNGKEIINYKISTKFENLFIRAYKKWPSMHGLNGFIQATPLSGHAHFYSSNLAIYFPNLFQHSHSFNKFDAQVDFKKMGHNLLLHASKIYLKNSDAEAKFELALKMQNIPLDVKNTEATEQQLQSANTVQPAIVQLIGSAKSSKMQNAAHYFPVGILPKKLHAWLTQAIQTGPHTTANARIIFQGALADFPFTQHDGRFIVESDIKKINLNYYPRWPSITEIDGNLSFDANQMFIHVRSGKIFDSSIKEASAYIDDLLANSIHLYVNGRVQGASIDGLKFLRESPLRNKIGQSLDQLTLLGNLDLDLKLDIPLGSTDPIRYTGNSRLTENQLKILDWNIVIDKINTLIHFDQDNIQTMVPSYASLWQRPIQFAIHTLKENNNSATSNLQINLNGALDASLLKKQFNAELLNEVSGHTNYHASLSIPANLQKQEQILTISSNLLGIKVALPKPLAKTAKELEPFLLKIYFGLPNKNQIKMSYGKKIAAALTFQKYKNKYQLYSGEMALGHGEANFQTIPGMLISGSLKGFDIPFWRNYLNVEKKNTKPSLKKGNQSNLRNLITRLNLDVPDFNLANFTIPSMHINGNKNTQGWQLIVNNTLFTGTITIPHNYPFAPVYAYFRRFNLSTQAIQPLVNHKKSTPINFKEIPPIILVSQETAYGSRNFGHVEMELRPATNGLTIHRLSSKTPHHSLIAQGHWLIHQGRGSSTFNGELKSNQLRRVLQDWQLPKNIDSNQALLQFNLSWFGTPLSPDLPSLQGNLNIKLGKGHISGINDGAKLTMGLGQIINILSIETLARQLKSGFSDVTKTGYSFDKMSGKFNFSHGNATTKDTKFDGPIADVALAGRIGYVHQDYDLNLAVAPELTSSLPLVATLAGGPVAGIAALAAKQILSPTLKKVTTYHYKVSGSWDKPHIKEEKRK